MHAIRSVLLQHESAVQCMYRCIEYTSAVHVPVHADSEGMQVPMAFVLFIYPMYGISLRSIELCMRIHKVCGLWWHVYCIPLYISIVYGTVYIVSEVCMQILKACGFRIPYICPVKCCACVILDTV